MYTVKGLKNNLTWTAWGGLNKLNNLIKLEELPKSNLFQNLILELFKERYLRWKDAVDVLKSRDAVDQNPLKNNQLNSSN